MDFSHLTCRQGHRVMAGGVLSAGSMNESDPGAYWAATPDVVVDSLGSSSHGLPADEAARRLRGSGPNRLTERTHLTRVRVLLNQVRNPLLLVLAFAATASALTDVWSDAAIVMVIIVATVGVGYSREYAAQAAAAALQGRIRFTAVVLREGRELVIPAENVVPGDMLLLAAGTVVAADAVIVHASDLFVSEAILTGESLPVRKQPGSVPAATSLRDRVNCVFAGTNVRSGKARCVVTATGMRTQIGTIAHRLEARAPEADFDRGLRHFGYVLTSFMVVMVFFVLIVHVLNGRPPIETLLFSIALAVGLSPELLPAILGVNLARGAQMMARHGVLVRRLNAIENLGSMDVLCTDKTGTLTEGVVRLEGAYKPSGAPAAAVQRLAAVNAALETGVYNPLDEGILAAGRPDVTTLTKVGEIPFDYLRKRISVIVEEGGVARLVTKGTFSHVVDICSSIAGGTALDDRVRAELEQRYERWSGAGIRVLAVASKSLTPAASYGPEVETGLCLEGFLTFLDQPKVDAAAAIASLARLGVAVKIISGDSKPVVEQVASLVGLAPRGTLTGAELEQLSADALWQQVEHIDLFVEVDPNQKERIILALKKAGHVVGFLGDGVNDAPAMHAADTSLSVERAVDVARQAADFVLLQPDLDVIRRGVEEGRTTFANTLKYILTTMSANLGNMISMALASLMLPFLPLLAGQILLNNFLSDIPAIGIAGDAVDPELIERPGRWDMAFITRYMVEFGVLSSLFDFVTFGVLLVGFAATVDVFRTGWFMESLLTELAIALVVRTRRPFFRSRPGDLLLWSTLVLIAATMVVPFLPGTAVLGFVAVPAGVLASIGFVTVLYVVAAEMLKQWFYRRTATSVNRGRRATPSRFRPDPDPAR
jgi:Mg2+-importing ATPase